MTPPIIITSMHRSGSSLLASMLHRAGLHLGDRLLAAGPNNQRGYYEDLDFLELHDDILARLGTTLYLESEPRGDVPPDLWQRAEQVVASRAGRPAWGWKDPRTSLFLDMWHEIVPDAHFVFVYRRPAEVADSLRRRGDSQFLLRYPGSAFLAQHGVPRFRTGRALRLWRLYNERIADFVERHRDRCRLVRNDRLADEVGPLVESLGGTDRELRTDVDLAGLIEPKLTVDTAPPAIERRAGANRRCSALMARLDALAGSTVR
jgi:hypothetical protein